MWRFITLVMVSAVAAAATVASPALAAETKPAKAAPNPGTSFTAPVNGTVTNAAGQTGTFDGQFRLTRFKTQGGRLVAMGTLTGTATVAGTTREIRRVVMLPVKTGASARRIAAVQQTCQILRLVLGPLDLNLLGLRIQLNQVILNITAEQGPGNLLGNVLCAVAGLLDGTSLPPSQVAQLLNLVLSLIALLS
jgi:hypothetical protein